jgi:ABC-type Fe3+/spermidine/putrescine transport system ATPase subunit
LGSTAVAVSLKGVSKRYGEIEAVKPLDLDVARQDFLAILGPSGCGKTTLLRIIGGFVRPTTGSIAVDGADVTALPPERRPTNMVFQGYGLFPHMTVRQNIAYGLKLRKLPADEISARVARVLNLVRLEKLADRSSLELSGGQAQRVAVARALVMEPPVLLLDEPFAALDLKLRQAMQEEMKRIHREVGGTFVFVTHDQGEALALANRIAVMNDGAIEQIGRPEDIYHLPRSRFVANFIGEANVLEGERRANRVVGPGGLDLSHTGPDGPVALVIRPEAVRILNGGAPADHHLDGRIEEVTFLGAHHRYVVLLPSGERLRAHRAGDDALKAGDAVSVGWSTADLKVVPA